METLRYAVVVGLSVVLTSCASGPTPEQIAAADYGLEMKPERCVEVAQPVLSDHLRDPGSAQFRHNSCYQGWWGSVPLLSMPVVFGYIQEGEVNGKNAYGGYVGFKPYRALVKNGFVIRYCITDNDGLCMPTDPRAR